MRDPITLSFLVPTRSEASWIVACVQCIRASTYTTGARAEILVCDGGSGDDTVEIARSMGVRVIETSPGRAHQINACAKHAVGDVLVMLHADALCTPGHIEAIMTAHRSGCVGGWFFVEILPELGITSGLGLDVMSRGINWRTRKFRSATGDQAIFVRREVFDQLGGLPEIALLEGCVFAEAMLDAGEVMISPEPVRISGRRWERDGVWTTMLRAWMIRAAYLAGVHPDTLARYWRSTTAPRAR